MEALERAGGGIQDSLMGMPTDQTWAVCTEELTHLI